MNTTTLTRLDRKITATLTQFKLMPNEGGQYPWQEAQQKNRNRRVVAATAGAAAIGAGAYGAKRGIDALKGRYGVESGTDALKVGAAEAGQKIRAGANQAGQRIKTAASPYVARAQDAVGQAGAAIKSGAGQVGAAVKRKAGLAGGMIKRGVASGRGVGSIAKRVGRALLMHEGGGVAPIIAFEARLDKVLAL